MALYDPAPSTIILQENREAAERFGITEEQVSNLRALAEGLLALPKDYQNFHMSHYFMGPEPRGGGCFILRGVPVVPDPSRCGTTACVLGHSPHILGVPVRPGEFWDDFGARVLGVRKNGRLTSKLWTYLFCARWAAIDDTPQGAGKRILRALRRGVPREYDPADCGLDRDYLEETL